jgi:hypothetical protein
MMLGPLDACRMYDSMLMCAMSVVACHDACCRDHCQSQVAFDWAVLHTCNQT